ncbi:pyridoxamine 5'-phosphate oxidase family protein [Tsukamurella sp. 8F]|uniref:pyridoxine 5'-phosphate oxidase C-terminal domain-containing protein n=1 Tax=unclassified Tsukamurella TaxID=2633480 RepID=UPI0023B9F503|nr:MULTISPECIES: pyridoxine 5'-phosphate oxidase C-terminal domain-containing protein [unclassified Tsukamurella]MDF0528840.1 pyridoxamine 5'-phosphate oxidase family protein [Tsukamurella sp. 8J]MDF0586675.1 pyridoxamine 5'-phosphate oxidase family protein [Tsukamurella sp. 8F]
MVTARPMDHSGHGELPPAGAWVSRKGERAYVYDLVREADPEPLSNGPVTGSSAHLRALPTLTGVRDAQMFGWSDDPVQQFRRWLDGAIEADAPEPHAAVVSTIDDRGIPDGRVLILREIDGRGWAVAGKASSRIGSQIRARPAAALTFWWQSLARSVRVRGVVVEAPREESDVDLAARSPQARADVAPGDWTLWRLEAERVEFWQGSTDRRHVRVVYSRDADGGWTVSASRGAEAVTLP